MGILRIITVVLMVICSLMFITCIFAIGNKEKGLKIHREMPPSSGKTIVDVKGIITFFTGLLYLISAIALIINIKPLALTGLIGAFIFVGFYIAEIVLWTKTYPQVWGGFLVFGTLSIYFGIYCMIFSGKFFK